MSMKNVFFLLLAILGFIAPNILVAIESVETGNVLLWLDPSATVASMFANRISTIFAIDLFWVVFVFICWTYRESRLYGIKNIWKIWMLCFLFGLGGAFPLFLYLREQKIQEAAL